MVPTITGLCDHLATAIEDQLGDGKKPKGILDNYEILQAFIGCFPSHSESLRLKLLGAVSSGTATAFHAA